MAEYHSEGRSPPAYPNPFLSSTSPLGLSPGGVTEAKDSNPGLAIRSSPGSAASLWCELRQGLNFCASQFPHLENRTMKSSCLFRSLQGSNKITQRTGLLRCPAHSRFSRSFIPSSQMGKVPEVSLRLGFLMSPEPGCGR